jgi:hypothetical protein
MRLDGKLAELQSKSGITGESIAGAMSVLTRELYPLPKREE